MEPSAFNPDILSSIFFLFSSVIFVKPETNVASLEKVTKAKLSDSSIRLIKYFKDSRTKLIAAPIILPETSTTQIKSTGFTFVLLSSVDNDTSRGV